MNNGYIKLHRQLTQWEWYTMPNHVHVFVHLLISANHKDGRWRGHEYKRGDVLTSLGKIASETGLSVRNVRTVLKNLESTGEISKRVTSQLTHLTLCNYDTYQSHSDQGDKPSDKRVTSKRQAGDNKQEGKNDKNDKNIYPTGFLAFWEVYPRKVSKGAAFKAFKSAMSRGAKVQDIIDGVSTSPSTNNKDTQFIPYASTWLNANGWEDEPAKPRLVDAND